MTVHNSRWMLLLIGAVIAQAFAAPASIVKLPGFSISLPGGKVIRQSTQPFAGEYVQSIDGLSAVAGPQVRILWASNSITRAEWRDNFLPMSMGVQIEGWPRLVLREREVDDKRWIAIVDLKDSPMGVGYVVCAPAFSVQVTLRQHRDLTALEAATLDLVRSVQCELTPINLQRPQLAVRLPEEFGDASTQKVTRYRSLSGEYISINFAPGNKAVDPQAFREFMRAAAGATISPGATTESLVIIPLRPRPDGRDAVLVRADLPGRNEPLYVAGLYCNEIRVTFMAIIELPRAENDIAETRLGQLHCPGSDGDALLPFAEVAAHACASGNTAACALKKP